VLVEREERKRVWKSQGMIWGAAEESRDLFDRTQGSPDHIKCFLWPHGTYLGLKMFLLLF